MDWGAGTIAHLCVFTGRQQECTFFRLSNESRSCQSCVHSTSDHTCYDVQAPQSTEPGGARPSRFSNTPSPDRSLCDKHFTFRLSVPQTTRTQSSPIPPETTRDPLHWRDISGLGFLCDTLRSTTFTSIPPAQSRRLFLASSLEQLLWHGYLPTCTYGRCG
jgi:hypothetical protein